MSESENDTLTPLEALDVRPSSSASGSSSSITVRETCSACGTLRDVRDLDRDGVCPSELELHRALLPALTTPVEVSHE